MNGLIDFLFKKVKKMEAAQSPARPYVNSICWGGVADW